MSPRRLVALATLSSVEHQTRQFDAITQGMTRDDLGIPVEVNRDDDVSDRARRVEPWMVAFTVAVVLAGICWIYAIAAGLGLGA